ncbi:MAG: hypothetical protein LBD42_00880 [Desulfovibrio sp.]|jgi:hypothetical protein|nr:hypothetical protein [Desulfovibrio sp.]
MEISIDELHSALSVVNDYIINTKKLSKNDFDIEYEETRVKNDTHETILRFSEKGEFLYDIETERTSKRTEQEYNYLENTYIFNVMFKSIESSITFFGYDGKSFCLEIDKKTMQVVRELKFQ